MSQSNRYFAIALIPLTWLAVSPASRRAALIHPQDENRAIHERLSVASLNIAMETRVERMLKELRGTPRVGSADVLMLQEVVGEEGKPSVAHQLAEALNYHVVFASSTGPSTFNGLAILSRYPLEDVKQLKLKECDVVFRCRKRLSLGATVRAPFGGVRVWNAHLDTRINVPDRLQQIEPVILEAEKFNGPRVIGGDLNTNPARWLKHIIPIPFLKQAKPVQQFMSRFGYHTPFGPVGPTHDTLGMQLDWIYVKGAQAKSAAVEPLEFSDHHAIWTQVIPVN